MTADAPCLHGWGAAPPLEEKLALGSYLNGEDALAKFTAFVTLAGELAVC